MATAKKALTSKSATRKTKTTAEEPDIQAMNGAAQAGSSNKGATANLVDIEERIRRRAYELFLERNGQGGDPQHDWSRAEAEIRGERTA